MRENEAIEASPPEDRGTERVGDESADQDALLAKLRELRPKGETISNPSLRRELGWADESGKDRYYRARNALDDDGVLERGVGYGGTVRLVPAEADEVVTVPAEVAGSPQVVEAIVQAEHQLYEPMRDVIAGDWAKDRRARPLAVEITALGGSKSTGGIWSRPDIVSVEVRAFPYVPGKDLDLVSFEIKPSSTINVQAVFEALAHRRRATRSYVLLHVPAASAAQLESAVAEVAEVARTHGIGLVTAEDPADYQTWNQREEAPRFEPNPELLNGFIATQLSEQTRDEIAVRLR